MKLKSVLIALALVNATMLFSGCTTTRELTTNTIDTLTVINPTKTTVIKIEPVAEAETTVTIPAKPCDTITVIPIVEKPFTPKAPPSRYKGRGNGYSVDVDLKSGTATVTKDADTSKHLFAGKKTEILPEPVNDSHWYDGVLYIIGAIVGLIIVGGLFYRFVILRK